MRHFQLRLLYFWLKKKGVFMHTCTCSFATRSRTVSCVEVKRNVNVDSILRAGVTSLLSGQLPTGCDSDFVFFRCVCFLLFLFGVATFFGSRLLVRGCVEQPNKTPRCVPLRRRRSAEARQSFELVVGGRAAARRYCGLPLWDALASGRTFLFASLSRVCEASFD